MKLEPIASNMTELVFEANGIHPETTILFSYKTPVACHIEGQGYFKTDQFWSVTTSRHINKWLKRHGAGSVQTKPQATFAEMVR